VEVRLEADATATGLRISLTFANWRRVLTLMLMPDCAQGAGTSVRRECLVIDSAMLVGPATVWWYQPLGDASD